MSTFENILDLVGNTPLVRINRLTNSGSAEVWAKLESYNPGGSVKDRIALAMVRAAEREGLLKPGGTIVEPTSGNTGVGLAMVAAALGYKLIICMPESASLERRQLIKTYGGELILTPADQGMKGAIAKAQEILKENPDFFMPQQFENLANPEIHRQTTALEILEQTDGKFDAFVAGIGTGGTITGCGEVFRQRGLDIKIYAVEPEKSPVLSGGRPGSHKIQGIGAGFVPKVLNTEVYDEIIQVSDEEALNMVAQLARQEGILAGISSGAAMTAALKVAEKLGTGKRVVVILPDTGERYLSMSNLFADNL
ncbi:MAG: cysteine synthase A [Firmicutes bacterium]|jgi:cysteine synthase A|nr:cysteine synthase A [Bacillota bacterium]